MTARLACPVRPCRRRFWCTASVKNHVRNTHGLSMAKGIWPNYGTRRKLCIICGASCYGTVCGTCTGRKVNSEPGRTVRRIWSERPGARREAFS